MKARRFRHAKQHACGIFEETGRRWNSMLQACNHDLVQSAFYGWKISRSLLHLASYIHIPIYEVNFHNSASLLQRLKVSPPHELLQRMLQKRISKVDEITGQWFQTQLSTLQSYKLFTQDTGKESQMLLPLAPHQPAVAGPTCGMYFPDDEETQSIFGESRCQEFCKQTGHGHF